jgi:ABC-type bacteriocin/lantibiotic exporter with double-glycine peptidase domain
VQTSLNIIGYGKEPVMALSKIIASQQTGEVESTPSETSKDHLQNHVFDTLVLKNVSYNYPGSDQKSISGLSLKVEKGDFIGLIGPSGAGKTSLVNLILGFLKPETGSIEFNKSDIYKNLPFWRARCAYLPQDIFLINTSLKENITLEKNFTDSNSLSKAIELSRLSKHIESLPEGIETNIGDRGARLSGGQRQRVAIARAIYHQRDLLILDESTSALDSTTEKEVMQELIGLRKEKTIIAIAHRISTLKECNKIFKLNAGIIEGPFSYDEISQEN